MPPRILIAVPALDFMPTICARGLLALCAYPLKDRLSGKPIARPNVGFQMGSLIMDARNVLAEEALKLDASHIFFLDSDILTPPDALQRLLSRRKPIIGASYVKRQAEGEELSGLIGRPEPQRDVGDVMDRLIRAEHHAIRLHADRNRRLQQALPAPTSTIPKAPRPNARCPRTATSACAPARPASPSTKTPPSPRNWPTLASRSFAPKEPQ